MSTFGAPLVFLTPHSGLRQWRVEGQLADGTEFGVLGTGHEVAFAWNATQVAKGYHLRPEGSPSGLLSTSLQIDARAPIEHRAAIVVGFHMLQRQWAYERETAQRGDDFWLYWAMFD